MLEDVVTGIWAGAMDGNSPDLGASDDNDRGLVVILAGAICYIWDFFLEHSYARVGLYHFSTVIPCRLARAQKYCYAKVKTKIAIVPLAFHLTPTDLFL